MQNIKRFEVQGRLQGENGFALVCDGAMLGSSRNALKSGLSANDAGGRVDMEWTWSLQHGCLDK
jgi:hypothetical protein